MKKKKIKQECKKYAIINYRINSNKSIDVFSDVNLLKLNLTKIPLTFNKVHGDFNCSDNKLTSLYRSPKTKRLKLPFDLHDYTNHAHNDKGAKNERWY